MRSIIPFLLSFPLIIFACGKAPVSSGNQNEPVETLWGSSAGAVGSETKEEAYLRVKAAFGSHRIFRYYCAAEPRWPAWLPKETVTNISFKLNAKEVLTGTHDQLLKDFFIGLGSSAKIYWTYFHEPEDDIRDGMFTAAEYRNAFDHIINLQKALNKPNLVPTLCLMSYSLIPESGRNWRDYLPEKVELLSWDGYYRDQMAGDVSKVFSAVRAIARETGKPWSISETGVNKMKRSGQVNEPIPSETRKSLLTALAKDIKTTAPQPVFVTYFDSDPQHDEAYSDWRISDDPNMVTAWNAGRNP